MSHASSLFYKGYKIRDHFHLSIMIRWLWLWVLADQAFKLVRQLLHLTLTIVVDDNPLAFLWLQGILFLYLAVDASKTCVQCKQWFSWWSTCSVFTFIVIFEKFFKNVAIYWRQVHCWRLEPFFEVIYSRALVLLGHNKRGIVCWVYFVELVFKVFVLIFGKLRLTVHIQLNHGGLLF